MGWDGNEVVEVKGDGESGIVVAAYHYPDSQNKHRKSA